MMTMMYAMAYIIAIKITEARLPKSIGKVFLPLALSLTRSRILLPILIKPIVMTIGILNHTAYP